MFYRTVYSSACRFNWVYKGSELRRRKCGAQHGDCGPALTSWCLLGSHWLFCILEDCGQPIRHWLSSGLFDFLVCKVKAFRIVTKINVTFSVMSLYNHFFFCYCTSLCLAHFCVFFVCAFFFFFKTLLLTLLLCVF